MSKPMRWPDHVHRELLRMERHKSMSYRARRLVAHALVDCFNEGRAWCRIPKPLEISK